MGKPTGNHGEILSQNEGFKGKIIQLSAEVPIANPVWLILEGKFGWKVYWHDMYTHTNMHMHMYMYMYIYICVCI